MFCNCQTLKIPFFFCHAGDLLYQSLEKGGTIQCTCIGQLEYTDYNVNTGGHTTQSVHFLSVFYFISRHGFIGDGADPAEAPIPEIGNSFL